MVRQSRFATATILSSNRPSCSSSAPFARRSRWWRARCWALVVPVRGSGSATDSTPSRPGVEPRTPDVDYLMGPFVSLEAHIERMYGPTQLAQRDRRWTAALAVAIRPQSVLGLMVNLGDRTDTTYRLGLVAGSERMETTRPLALLSPPSIMVRAPVRGRRADRGGLRLGFSGPGAGTRRLLGRPGLREPARAPAVQGFPDAGGPDQLRPVPASNCAATHRSPDVLARPVLRRQQGSAGPGSRTRMGAAAAGTGRTGPRLYPVRGWCPGRAHAGRRIVRGLHGHARGQEPFRQLEHPAVAFHVLSRAGIFRGKRDAAC